jgi:hypothetical protein
MFNYLFNKKPADSHVALLHRMTDEKKAGYLYKAAAG